MQAKQGKSGYPSVSVRDEDFEQGTVKFVHRDGYGFIEREDKPDVYFHVARLDSKVVHRLVEGAHVLVAVGDGKRGPNALMVKIDE